MKIFDRSGIFYNVNDPERMFAEIDIDSLLVVYESTILGHEIHQATDTMMVSMGDTSDYPKEEVAAGIAEMRRLLTERDQELELEDIDYRIENYVIDVLKIKERKSEQS